MWKDIPNVNIVEITSESFDWEDIVDEAISNEDDTLILAGHGSIYGLLFPDYNYGTYIVHENNVHLIHAKNVIFSFCYASDFLVNNNIHGFATGMFITNEKEAYDNGILNYCQLEININNRQFQNEINWLLRNNISLDRWVMILGAHMDIENSIDVFNRQGLYYQ
jgi:hypothetical protein